MKERGKGEEKRSDSYSIVILCHCMCTKHGIVRKPHKCLQITVFV